MSLVSHHDKQPIRSLVFTDAGGEIAAVLALLEEVDISGSVITLDALHTTRNDLEKDETTLLVTGANLRQT